MAKAGGDDTISLGWSLSQIFRTAATEKLAVLPILRWAKRNGSEVSRVY